MSYSVKTVWAGHNTGSWWIEKETEWLYPMKEVQLQKMGRWLACSLHFPQYLPYSRRSCSVFWLHCPMRESTVEGCFAKCVGVVAMFFPRKRLKDRHHLWDYVCEDLYRVGKSHLQTLTVMSARKMEASRVVQSRTWCPAGIAEFWLCFSFRDALFCAICILSLKGLQWRNLQGNKPSSLF